MQTGRWLAGGLRGVSCRLAVALLLLGSGATAQLSAAPPAAPDPIRVDADKIDSLAHELLLQQKIPGMTLAVVDHGQIIYSSAYGLADLENKVQATPASEIRAASIAKPMTAIAVMQLVQQGKLDLDAPVQQYCPVFPAKTAPDGKPWVVTTRDLLSHRAGERWYRDDAELRNVKHYADVNDAVKYFAGEPLLFAPGEKMQYSTYGYVVAGCAIEGASQVSFADYMRRSVFLPAGMTATLADDPRPIIPHRARGYEKTKADELENAPFFDPSDRLPGGGWLSTSEDLARFAAAVMSGKLVTSATLEEVWKPLTTRDNGSGYGLGWEIRTFEGHRMVAHNGGQTGTSTSLKLVPDRQLAVAVMTNLEGAKLDDFAEAILKLFLAGAGE
jgi:serine beta-lactamase-like protein LACTB, mitochondrial